MVCVNTSPPKTKRPPWVGALGYGTCGAANPRGPAAKNAKMPFGLTTTEAPSGVRRERRGDAAFGAAGRRPRTNLSISPMWPLAL